MRNTKSSINKAFAGIHAHIEYVERLKGVKHETSVATAIHELYTELNVGQRGACIRHLSTCARGGSVSAILFDTKQHLAMAEL